MSHLNQLNAQYIVAIIFFSFWATDTNFKICKNEHEFQTVKVASSCGSGIWKNFLWILSGWDKMSRLYDKHYRTNLGYCIKYLWKQFGNNSWGGVLWSQLSLALERGLYTPHPNSQFNDLSLGTWNHPWWEEIGKCCKSGLPCLCR